MYCRYMRKDDISGLIAGVHNEINRIKLNRKILKDELRKVMPIVYAGDINLFIYDNKDDIDKDILLFIEEMWKEIKEEDTKNQLNDVDLTFLKALDEYILNNDNLLLVKDKKDCDKTIIKDDNLLKLYRLSLSQYNYNFYYYIDRIFNSDYAGYIDYIYMLNNYYELKK